MNLYFNIMYPRVITFEHPHMWCEKSKYVLLYSMECDGDKCTNQYIHLEDYDLGSELKNADEIVAPEKFIIIIDYPIKNPIQRVIVNKNPITRLELVRTICELYKKIYKEEDGILAHNLSCLDLVKVIMMDKNESGIPVYRLDIDSS